MKDTSERIRKQQEQASALAARRALDEDNPTKALLLAAQVTEFWPQNIVTLLAIIGFHSQDHSLVRQAQTLFATQLKLCTNAKSLVQIGVWMDNPRRKKSLPDYLRTALDTQRKMLEPDWDGKWVDPGLASSNKALTIINKHPSEVHDPIDCLIAASQVGNWDPWIRRYDELNGSHEDPRYLKLMVAKFVPSAERPSYRIKDLLKKFTRTASAPEVRRFLRSITPTRATAGEKSPNPYLAYYALFLYCECERLEHTVMDWVHVAESALFLDHYTVARAVQRILAEAELDPAAELVYARLVQKNGQIQRSLSPLADIGPRGSPIWQSIYHRIPVNTDAAKILSSYSRRELDSE